MLLSSPCFFWRMNKTTERGQGRSRFGFRVRGSVHFGGGAELELLKNRKTWQIQILKIEQIQTSQKYNVANNVPDEEARREGFLLFTCVTAAASSSLGWLVVMSQPPANQNNIPDETRRAETCNNTQEITTRKNNIRRRVRNRRNKRRREPIGVD